MPTCSSNWKIYKELTFIQLHLASYMTIAITTFWYFRNFLTYLDFSSKIVTSEGKTKWIRRIIWIHNHFNWIHSKTINIGIQVFQQSTPHEYSKLILVPYSNSQMRQQTNLSSLKLQISVTVGCWKLVLIVYSASTSHTRSKNTIQSPIMYVYLPTF